ncbi:SusD/RagB family nutrient-binding outer membrane lipoprotein [Fibrella aquatilis]|uniref:SusD/RagB family nutrient-binding outer membrane lipoprotein n=1 Tax=Fibrella aquatilis TaxID=2817059 RepID=A0A939G851_9BACT|nr:SusD/RagB family nutrient-binding outer membrane lipoprotein [Fibrella aquatilis]MBO0932130.1 SusD/RagB family nutrient-binding outer membrane lipoprotein [Fibrella aquatilis]
MMHKFKLVALLVALLSVSSCKEGYLDINKNPNSATSSTPDLILPAALNATAAGMVGANEIGHFWAGQWSPSGSVSGFNPEKTYDLPSNFRTGLWTGAYDNLSDYDVIEQAATTSKQPAFVGIAKVMKAFVFQRLVDTYGNVPYTEALKGTAVLRPKYDDAQAIYDDLSKQLDAAVTALKVPIATENPSPGASDIVFAGDMAKWVRFANTLKLRILLRQTNIAAKDAAIKAEVAKTAGNGGFLAAGENALSTPGYLKSAGKQNPFYENYGFTPAGTLSGNHDFYTNADFFITFLSSNVDPRLPRFATLNNANRYVGVPFGDGNDAYLYAKTSGFGPAILKGFDQKQVLMQSAESFFLQAEAAQRGYLGTSAKTLFETGVAESFKFLEVPDAAKAAAAYVADPVAIRNFDASPNKLEAIITQKWVALGAFGGFEAWAEFRRTGFPKVPLSTRAVGTKQPARFLYPNQELGTNEANVKAQGTISQFDTKIFWMK